MPVSPVICRSRSWRRIVCFAPLAASGRVRLRRLAGSYGAHGGEQTAIAIATAWIGAAPAGVGVADGVFRAAAAPGMRKLAGFRQGPHTGSPDEVAASLGEFVAEAGVSALNL